MTTQTDTCVKPITPDERHVIKMLKNYVALRSYLDHLKEDQNPKDYRTILPYDLGECEDCLLEGPGSEMGLIEIMGWCTNDKCLDEGDSCDYCIFARKIRPLNRAMIEYDYPDENNRNMLEFKTNPLLRINHADLDDEDALTSADVGDTHYANYLDIPDDVLEALAETGKRWER